MLRFSVMVLFALAPLQALACPASDTAGSKVQVSALQTIDAMSVEERNAIVMKAALGGDDTHSTDADLN